MKYYSLRYPAVTRKATKNSRLAFLRKRAVVFAALPIFIIGVALSMLQPAGAAIAFRAASSANNGGGTTSLNIATPTGTLAGDVMVAIISVRGGTGTTITAPSGWNVINTNTSGTTLRSSVYYKVATASEGTHSFTFASEKAAGVIASYSGVDNTTPIMAQANQVNGSSTTMTAPTITTTDANAWVVAAYSIAVDASLTAGSSMTLRGQNASTGNSAASRDAAGLQDASQAIAGSTGTKIMTASDNAVNIGHTIALTPAPAVSQVGYRWMTNQDSTAVGAPLAMQDTNMVSVSVGQPVRLRILLGVTEKSINSGTAYKLQYKNTTSSTCDGSGSFFDVTTTTPVQFYNNASTTDGSALTSHVNDPVRSGVTVVNQTYEEANNFAVATTVPAGQDGKWDFALVLGSSASMTGDYCLRVVNSNGGVLASYSQVPLISRSYSGTMLAQQDYRVYQNANDLTPGAPLALTNTSAALATSGDQFRVRMTANGQRGWLSVSAGEYHTCAIASDNQAYCWGSDTNGQLGNGSTTGDQIGPTAVYANGALNGKTILSISTGVTHTCAVASDNQVYCWGADTNGQLGNGATTADQASPVAVDTSGVLSDKNIINVAIGENHTCVIASDNQAYCWGSDASGEIGNGATTGDQTSPVAVDTSGVLSGKNVIAISAGDDHTCAIASDNQAYCWGIDFFGQLGNGATTGNQTSPVAVDSSGVLSGKTILGVSSGSGDYHTCAIASDNQAYCWGSDSNSQLGNGATAGNQVSPVAVDTSGALNGKTILSMTTSNSHTCAIASDNQAYCWGSDSSSQLGNGATTGTQSSPAAVDTSGVLAGKSILNISTGLLHTCAIASDNQAYCWGNDVNGQIGNGTITSDQESPALVNIEGGFSGKTIWSISAGHDHSCAINSDNQAYCWGDDEYGALGNGASTGDQPRPVAVDTSGVLNGKSVIYLVSGTYHACAIASDNQIYCWGNDGDGQLGNGATTGSQASPVAVDTSGDLAGKTALSLTAGAGHACAIASDNQAYCWGGNYSGQLGDGTIVDSAVPVAVDTSGVLAGKTILSISAGASHTCAVASDNQAYCWGSDDENELGNDAAIIDQPNPVAVDTSGVLAGKTILSISAGGKHTCAIASDNQAYCWGSDSNNQLGNGATTGTQASPVAVDTSGVLAGKTILSLSASSGHYLSNDYHTCAIASDNQAYCWGAGSAGRLGNGATTTQSSPVAVDTSGVLAGKTVINIVGGKSHTCAIASDNQAYCWGANSNGRLGNGDPSGSQLSPVGVAKYLIDRFPIQSNGLSLALEYAQKSAANCVIQTGYTTVTTVSAIALHDNVSVSNSDSINTHINDPVGYGALVPQTYHDFTGTITKVNSVADENRGLWDISLKDNAAPANTTYCLRFAINDGTVLGEYNYYPEITTAGGATLDQMTRGGQSVINGIKSIFSW